MLVHGAYQHLETREQGASSSNAGAIRIRMTLIFRYRGAPPQPPTKCTGLSNEVRTIWPKQWRHIPSANILQLFLYIRWLGSCLLTYIHPTPNIILGVCSSLCLPAAAGAASIVNGFVYSYAQLFQEREKIQCKTGLMSFFDMRKTPVCFVHIYVRHNCSAKRFVRDMQAQYNFLRYTL